MTDRDRATIRRFVKIALLALLPVIISSLQQEVFDWRAMAISAGIAVLAALEKYLMWDDVPTNGPLSGPPPSSAF